MLPIGCWFAEFFLAGVLFLLDAPFRRCIPDIFIPGMFMPGILLMSCFVAVCLWRVGFLFFREVAVDLDFAFGLLIPGILDISCCARTGTLTSTSMATNKNIHIARELNFNTLMPFIIPPRKFLTKEDNQRKLSSAETKRFSCFGWKRIDAFQSQELKRPGGTRSEKR